jgi:hypothetical protein
MQFWVEATPGTPLPIPERKDRGKDNCEYCGTPLTFIPLGEVCTNKVCGSSLGEVCTNKVCGYADGFYWPKEAVSGHCSECEKIVAAEEAAVREAENDFGNWLEAFNQPNTTELHELYVAACDDTRVSRETGALARHDAALRSDFDARALALMETVRDAVWTEVENQIVSSSMNGGGWLDSPKAVAASIRSHIRAIDLAALKAKSEGK